MVLQGRLCRSQDVAYRRSARVEQPSLSGLIVMTSCERSAHAHHATLHPLDTLIDALTIVLLLLMTDTLLGKRASIWHRDALTVGDDNLSVPAE